LSPCKEKARLIGIERLKATNKRKREEKADETKNLV